MRRRAAVLLVVFLLILTFPAVAGEAQWFEVRSPHFSVVTDAGEKRAREVAVRFEQMRSVFSSLMAQAKVNLPIPLQIVAFRNGKELKEHGPIWQGKPVELAGLFISGQDHCFILLDMSVENPWQVVFHEYAHQLMNGSIQLQLDPWFEEGFAEYFRTITVDGQNADVGRIPDDEYYVLDHTSWLKIADLFRVQQSSATYNENGDHRNVFYAQSGLVVHYIYENGLLPKLATYFELTKDKHAAVEEAIQKAFGMSAAQFDKSLHEYENGHRFKFFKVPAPAGIDGKTYTGAAVAPLDAQAILADIDLHTVDHNDRAETEFQAVLKIDPENAAALRGLGYSALIKQDYEKAGEYFHKAAARNSNDPRVLYYSAMLAQRAGKDEEEQDRLATMQKELEACVKLDPDFADAYSMLAFTYMSQSRLDDAVKTLTRAVELNPRNNDYRLNLARLYMQKQQFSDAVTILKMVQGSSDPRVSLQARNFLEEIQRYQEPIRTSGLSPEHPTSDNLVADSSKVTEPPAQPLPANIRPAKFLHGKVVTVECTSPPKATLTISEEGVTWKMNVANSDKAIVIGADAFSCKWKNQKVAVNFRQTGEGQGDVISLEIQ